MKEFRTIITMKNGMHKIIRMSYAEIAHELQNFKFRILMGEYERVRIITNNKQLFLELA